MHPEQLQAIRTLIHKGDLQQAQAACGRILATCPQDAEARFLLATTLLLDKQYEQCEPHLQQIVAADPRHAGALNNLGLIELEHRRNLEAAKALFLRVVALEPSNINAWLNLGNIAIWQGDDETADRYARAVLDLDPGNEKALNNLGTLAVRKGDAEAAIGFFRQALELAPEHPQILTNLMLLLGGKNERRELYRMMIKVLALANPGIALFPAYSSARALCQWEMIRDLHGRIVELSLSGHAMLRTFQAINISLLATPEIDDDQLFSIHRATGRVIERECRAPINATPAGPIVNRRMRLGFLSSDYRKHVVSSFFRAFINHYDRERFEVTCYSNTRTADEITEEYRRTADHFVDVTALDDCALAQRIRHDAIDVLVDLNGYTTDSRISVTAYRPAPVQATYLGYPYTSGISSIDYLITDPHLTTDVDRYVERCLPLAESFICIGNQAEQVIEPHAPLESQGYVTFGSLANPYKLNPRLIAVWAAILRGVPDARLILNHPNYDLPEVRSAVEHEFRKHQVEPHRLRFVWQAHPGGSHLRYYNEIDIALDTFPLTGGTTTIDTVWMGVPVVTLVGRLFHHRISYSSLMNLGIPVDDLIAFDEEEYLAKSIALAGNTERILELRRKLPEAMRHSVLCDPIRFTRHMEAALVEAWNTKYPGFPANPGAIPETRLAPLLDGTRIAVPDTTDHLDRYVLEEQRACFEPEHPFVAELVKPGMHVVDIWAGAGLYALPLARRVGREGRVTVAEDDPRLARRLVSGIEANALDNVVLLSAAQRRIFLDRELAQTRPADFVRLDLRFTPDTPLQDAADYFRRHSPLVMVGVRRDGQAIDTAYARHFADMGYGIYRLVPGLQLLAPLAGDADLDTFATNLFACKPDRAAVLQNEGVLACQSVPLESFPGISDTEWIDWLAQLPYSSARCERWGERMRSVSDWEAYWSALNLFVRAKQGRLPAAQRLACLNASIGILGMLVQASVTLPRLLSFARALSEAGKREQAAALLQQLVELVEAGTADLDAEPFLAPSSLSEMQAPGEEFNEWLLAGVLEQFERLRAFSSYFSGLEVAPMLERLISTGFSSEEMKKRLDLIRTRAGSALPRHVCAASPT